MRLAVTAAVCQCSNDFPSSSDPSGSLWECPGSSGVEALEAGREGRDGHWVPLHTSLLSLKRLEVELGR